MGEFLAHLASLVVSGLAARSRQALAAPIGQILAQVLCWAAIACVTWRLSAGVASVLKFGGWSTLTFATAVTVFVLPALAIALFTAGQARLAGLIGLVWFVWTFERNLQFYALRTLIELSPAAIGFMVMAIAPRHLPRTGRSLWLVLAGVTVLVGLTTVNQYLVLIGPSWPLALVALLFLPVQPTFALGTALTASAWASQMVVYGDPPGQILMIALLVIITPATLILTGLARRAATHR